MMVSLGGVPGVVIRELCWAGIVFKGSKRITGTLGACPWITLQILPP